MANTFTLDEYADCIKITTDAITQGYLLRKSYTSNVAYADTIYTQLAGGANLEAQADRSVVQGHTYFYWITEANGSTVVVGPTAGRLKQRKLFGRGGGLTGAKRKKTWDYDVSCELCPRIVRRNTLRRGYVRPHQTGENYLPNGAAPENWTHTNPDYFDANTWNWWINAETTPAFVFPCIEKDSDYRTPPGQNRWPGTPIGVDIGIAPPVYTIGTPTAAKTGYIILWIMHLVEGSGAGIRVQQNATVLVPNTSIGGLAPYSWHKRIYEDITWNATEDITMHLLGGSLPVPSIIFGGMQLVTENPEMAALPHRSSAAGVYTTGGMMNLCTECYSGLRKRVPWG